MPTSLQLSRRRSWLPAKSTLSAGAVAIGLTLGAAACSSSPTNSTGSTGSTGAGAASTTSSPAASSSSATVKVDDNATFGKILVNSAGMALYTFSGDVGHNGMSQCTGGCLQAWPALTVAAGKSPTAGPGVTGTLAAVMQSGGADQVTYNGLPLYTFVQDSAAGEVTGNGSQGFSVAKVSGSGSSGGSSPSTTATTSGGGGY